MKRLMIAGFGDVARRALPRLEDRFEVLRIARRYGCDLDRPESPALEGADALFHCAPPPGAGESDTRTANLLAALEKGRILPARVVYVSTSGVYGDCAGARVDESRPPAPQTPRARRRVDAERRLTLWCEARGIALVILRAPGIYAADRLPLERLRAGFELVAEHAGLPRPTRVTRAQMVDLVPEDLYSFMCESRRLDNRRMKQVLGVRLRYPTCQGLRHEHALGVD